MKFFDCATAPSPRRVRMFIREKGLDIPAVEVDLRNRKQFDPEFVRKNPRCTVPVLELDSGEFITDTLAICCYLEDRFPDPPLMGQGPEQRARIIAWYMRILEDGFMSVSESFRNRAKGFRGHALTGPEGHDQIPQLVERGRKRAERFLDDLDGHLSGREYIVGESFTLADIAALATIDFAVWIKLDIGGQRGHLRRWYEAVSSRPSAHL